MLSKEQCNEGNALIAAYMGFGTPDAFNMYSPPEHFIIPILRPTWTDLRFHCSYDWIMQVVSKIEQTHEVSIIFNECEISTTGYRYTAVAFAKSDTKLESIWLACVEFIKKFNAKEL